jgi:CubicO group peptidase (beta-lactamase class C family)
LTFLAGRIALLVVLLLTAMPTHPASQDAPPLAFRLSQTVPDRMVRDDVAGAVIVLIEDGAPIWTAAFGMADPATGRAIDPDALFRVGTISKPVTAWGAMRLAEAGRLNLAARIGACFRRWQLPEGTAAITPRMLLSHSAGIGLGDHAARYPPLAPRPDLSEHIAQDFALIAAHGSGFAYSDTGYALLELVIQGCCGEDFGALMAREVLAPLGMTTARFEWTDTPMAVGHGLRGRPVAP